MANKEQRCPSPAQIKPYSTPHLYSHREVRRDSLALAKSRRFRRKEVLRRQKPGLPIQAATQDFHYSCSENRGAGLFRANSRFLFGLALTKMSAKGPREEV